MGRLFKGMSGRVSSRCCRFLTAANRALNILRWAALEGGDGGGGVGGRDAWVGAIV